VTLRAVFPLATLAKCGDNISTLVPATATGGSGIADLVQQ
jgi:hypothetical protein